MKKLLLLFVSLTLSLTVWCQDGTNNTTIDERRIIFNGTGHEHRLVDEMPTGVFNVNTRMLTIEFPAAGFVSYTLSVSSDDATLNYTVTSPLYRVYVPTDVVEVDLQLVTDSGDIFYGSFEATGGTMI